MDNSSATFLMLGEAVVDFISSEYVSSLKDATCFSKFAGGEVANLSVNLSRMGFRVLLGSCLGSDDLGNFHQRAMRDAGVDLSLLQTTSTSPTTIIIVTRQTDTPDFMIYRGADYHLELTENLFLAAKDAQGIHTSAFALSRDPCRSTIRTILESVGKTSKIISLDPNYHPALSPDIDDFLPFLKGFMQNVTIIKPSLDDSTRIFGPGLEPKDYLTRFLDLGPELVVLTMGSQGSLIGTSSGERFHIHPRPVSVADATGAGDAFWSGLLGGLVSDHDPLISALLGHCIAEYKIGFVGPIVEPLSLEHYLEQAQTIIYREL